MLKNVPLHTMSSRSLVLVCSNQFNTRSRKYLGLSHQHVTWAEQIGQTKHTCVRAAGAGADCAKGHSNPQCAFASPRALKPLAQNPTRLNSLSLHSSPQKYINSPAIYHDCRHTYKYLYRTCNSLCHIGRSTSPSTYSRCNLALPYPLRTRPHTNPP